MSALRTGVCPSCDGERMVRHPAGFVWLHAMRCPLLAAEDATKAADHERMQRRARTSWARPATATELALLAACGVTGIDPTTTVTQVTQSVLRRSWHGVDLDGDGAVTS